MLIRKLFFSLIVLLPFASIGQGLLIKPAKIDFNLERGQNRTQTLLIKNGLDQKMQFRLYLGDWLRDTVGGHKYMEPGTNDFSCSNWIKLDQEFVELQPGESKNIIVTMNIPDTEEAITKMRWAMIFVENIEETTAPDAGKGLHAGVKQIMRMGIHVYQTPSGVVEKDMRMLSFENAPGADNRYRITCQNTGAVQIECKSYLELLNLSTGIKTKIEGQEFPMFPNQKRYINFDLPESLPKGKYQVIAAVDAGEDVPLEAAQKTIEIK